MYFNQESFIFHPLKINKETNYIYSENFKEINLKTSDNVTINNLYFETKNPKGVVYFLHGNAGNLSTWGNIAPIYLELGYNVLITDYRGFGKSEGNISDQTQLFSDAQLGYDFLKKEFKEDQIIIVGYSIGTGIASYLASANNPQKLILQAPYFNLKNEMKSRFPFLPTFILKYPFENNLHISKVKSPIFIFHGDKDYVISHQNSLKLQSLLKENDSVFILKNQDHVSINNNAEYHKNLIKILNDSI
ncbi:alpha/beta hydrolase [Paenimyroides ummariense]|nr:alpha/beta fold hydrolase [Paenimyroides ummariense]